MTATPPSAARQPDSAEGQELPVTFDCDGVELVGMVHRPAQVRTRGLLLLVAGGPQYRGGVGRLQLLLARALAASGTPVMRFDHRGIGDSEGVFRDFEDVEADLRAAIQAFLAAVPGLHQVVLWGGCNAASAIMINAWKFPEVTGIAVSNPWVHTVETADAAVVSQHFSQRMREWDFWRKVLRLHYNPLPAMATLARAGWRALRARLQPGAPGAPAGRADDLSQHFILRMQRGMAHFSGDMLLLMSGRSMVSKEFDALVASSPDWQRALQQPRCLRRHDMPDADQTHSSVASRLELVHVARAWMQDPAGAALARQHGT